MSNLKPCPFCGNEAEFVQLHPLHDSPVGVGCSSCPVILAEYGDYKLFNTEAEAIAAWNTRPATTVGKVQVEIEPVLLGMLTADNVRDLIDQNSYHISGNMREFFNVAYEAIADELNAIAGTPEIVRCKDCKRWKDDCEWNRFFNDPDLDDPEGFCAWGKRKAVTP